MGELTKTVLGRISGRVGDVVFRQLDGKNYVSSRPGSYPVTDDPVILGRRSNFGLTIGFASAVNSIEALQGFWKPFAPQGFSAYNLMCSKNYPFIDKGVIGDRAMIVPALGFEATATSIDLTNTQLSAVIAALGQGTGIDDNIEANMHLAAVVHLSSPQVDLDEPNEMLALLSASQPVDLLNPLTFNIPLDNIEGQLFDAYQVNKVFAALYTVDATGTPIRFSNTLIG